MRNFSLIQIIGMATIAILLIWSLIWILAIGSGSEKENDQKSVRPTVGTYVVPPGKIITRTIDGKQINYAWRGNDCQDMIYIDIQQGYQYKKLIWVGQNGYKSWPITKDFKKFRASPGENSFVSFKNTGDHTMVAKVWVKSCQR